MNKEKFFVLQLNNLGYEKKKELKAKHLDVMD
jgi:hypothetical protein